MKFFDNKMLRRIFGPKEIQEGGENYRMNYLIISLHLNIMMRRMGHQHIWRAQRYMHFSRET
jgi:hypothetical protein